MLEMFSRVMPVILLFALGYLIRQKKWVTSSGMDGVKRIVINLALPAVLFKTFLTMELDVAYFGLTFTIFLLMVLMFVIGRLLNLFKSLHHMLMPYLSTGVSFGLLGIPLFSIVFGEDNLGIFSVIGLGNELFVWFVFYTLLHMELNNEKFTVKHFAGFFKSPVISAIFLGMILNLLNLSNLFISNHFLAGVYSTVSYVSAVATPLMLMTIGYGMDFDKKYLLLTTKLVMVRMFIFLVAGYGFKLLVINRLFDVTPIMNYAYMTFLMLPPLFSLPIFIGISGDQEDEELASNVVVAYTAFSLFLFVVVAIIFL